jgi:hypothetical protein
MRAVVHVVIVVSAGFIAGSAGFAAAPVVAPAERSADIGHVPEFARGTPKETIATRLGMPSQVFGPTLWIYREFFTRFRDADRRGYDTLVVIFADNRVVTMRVVNGEELDALLAAQRRAAALAQSAAPPPRP